MTVLLWVAQQDRGMPPWMTMTNFLAIVAALSPVLLLVIGKRLNTQLEDANARNADANTRKTDADTARQLIAEARQIMQDKEALADAKIERAKVESAGEIEKVRAMAALETADAKARLSRLEIDLARLQHTLAVHIPWDVEAWARVRAMDPDFPEPPALEAPRAPVATVTVEGFTD